MKTLNLLGFKVSKLSGKNKVAFHPIYGCCYGQTIRQLVDEVSSTIINYHL